LLALQRWAFGEIHYDFTAAVVLLFIGVGVLFPRVHSMAERLLGQSLFRSKFAAHATLDALASEVVRVLDRQKLIILLCERIGEAFGIEQIALYLREGSSGGLRIRHEIGAPLLVPNLERDHWLVRRLSLIEEVVLREEIEGHLPTDQTGIARDHMGWAVAVPFHSGRELIGFLCLGPKKRLEAFSSGDLSILGRVAAEASIALQNARLFEELRQSRAIISRAGRLSAIGTLAAGIAHEIRNPLVSIQTFFQLAPQRLNDEEFMTSFLKLAEAEVQRIGNLISELLLFAKSPTPTLRTVSIGEIAERAVILLEPQARTQGIKLTLVAEPESAGVLADGDQLMQVVLNLGLNAIQATPRGGEVTVETRPVSQDGISYCQLEIRDTGQGIPDALRDAIFDPFFTTKDKGTGLGLSIAHQIVAECGGHISVVSEEGVGSRFVVNLPADDSELNQDPMGRVSA
jgi:signal transduction histidine kinase